MRFRRNQHEDEHDRHDAGVATDPPPPHRDDRVAPGEQVVEEGRPRGGRYRDRDAAPLTRDHMVAARERQRVDFGGINWGSVFFGWLVAIGLAALLTGLLSAAGAALGFTEVSEAEAEANAETIGIAGGVLLLAVVMLAYYAGGYVAGRMSRFDGARQGFGVWAFGLLAAIVLGVLAGVAGSEYNVFANLDLPRIPVDEGDLTTGGLIALALAVIGTLLAAVAGGKVGERYHRRVDRAAFEPRG